MMSNIIPRMLSSTPPPIDNNILDEEDDEFGDFSATHHDDSINMSQLPYEQSDPTWTDDVEQLRNDPSINLKAGTVHGTSKLTELQDPNTEKQDLSENAQYTETMSIELIGIEPDNTSQSSLLIMGKASGSSFGSLSCVEISSTTQIDSQETTNISVLDQKDPIISEESVEKVDFVESISNDAELPNDKNYVLDESYYSINFNDQVPDCSASSNTLLLNSVANIVSGFRLLENVDSINNLELQSREGTFVEEDSVVCEYHHEHDSKDCGSVTSTFSQEINSDDVMTTEPSDDSVSQVPTQNTTDSLDTNLSTGYCTLETKCGISSNSNSIEFTQNRKDLQFDQDWDDDDFSDFTSNAVSPSKEGASANDNEFDNCMQDVSLVTNCKDFQDDEDFDDFESASVPDNAEKQYSSLVTVVSTLFPGPDSTIIDDSAASVGRSIVHTNIVWSHLQDVDTSNALTYQWANSSANKLLLTALGIDARNVLFGPKWNIAVPRFAANLGISPLQPVRASSPQTLMPTPGGAQQAPELTPNSERPEDIFPVAQFDWNSSGLINPFDNSEKEDQESYQDGHKILSNGKTIFLTSILSSEAEHIIASLPDLSFMRAETFVFPSQTSRAPFIDV